MNRKGLVFKIIIALLVALGVLFLYFKIQSSKEIVTIAPEEGETKKKPDDPGGIIIPNSDSLVYEKLQKTPERNRKINILPEPEEPIQINQKPDDNKVKFIDSIDEILANIEYTEDEIIGKSSAAEELPIEEHAEDSQQIEVYGTKLNVTKSSDNRFKVTGVNVAGSDSAGYKIQLTTAFSESDAKKLWQEITKRHSKILNDANLITRKVEGKNEHILYLVMAGTYPSLNHAKLVCNKLISRKQNCIVTK